MYNNMKKIALLSIMLLLSAVYTFGQAQTYLPVLVDGRMWKLSYAENGVYQDIPNAYMTITVEGDTIVNGKNCKKLIVEHSPLIPVVYPKYIVAYEKDGKLYWIDKEGKDNLVMDMNLHELDYCDEDYLSFVVVEDFVIVDGVKRKRLVIDSGASNGKYECCYYMVEGIGLSKDEFVYTGLNGRGYFHRMLACYDNGKCIFSALDFTKDEDTRTLYTPGKMWIYHNENTLMPSRDYYWKVSVASDTIVNGVNAKCLVHKRIDDDNNTDHDMSKEVVYEENGIIYGLNGYGKFTPLMNFNLRKGDVFYLVDPSTGLEIEDEAMIVADENIYFIESIARRVLTIKKRDSDSGYGYWIEGIGASNPLDYITVQSITTDGSRRYLSECWYNGEPIFLKDNFDVLTGIDEVPSPHEPRHEAVYDLMGRRVARPIKGHLYITASGKRVW